MTARMLTIEVRCLLTEPYCLYKLPDYKSLAWPWEESDLGFFLGQIDAQFPQTVTDFAVGLGNSHAFLDHQLAGEGHAVLRSGAEIVMHAAVLALLVPAATAQGDGFRGQILQGAQQHVPFGHGNLLHAKGDLDELLKRSKQGARPGHAEILPK